MTVGSPLVPWALWLCQHSGKQEHRGKCCARVTSIPIDHFHLQLPPPLVTSIPSHFLHLHPWPPLSTSIPVPTGTPSECSGVQRGTQHPHHGHHATHTTLHTSPRLHPRGKRTREPTVTLGHKARAPTLPREALARAGRGVNTGAETEMAFPPLSQLQVHLGALPGRADVGRSGWGRREEARAGAAGAGSAESLGLCSPLPAPPRTFCSHSAPPDSRGSYPGARAGAPSDTLGFGEQDMPSLAHGTGTQMMMGTWAHPSPR